MRLTVSLIILTLMVLTLPALVLTTVSVTRELVLDSLQAEYLEDEQTGRRIADLRMRLVAVGDHAILLLQIAATGDRVDPVPSFRGVHGANHITARDLTELIETNQLRILAMPRHGTGKRFGTVTPGESGRIPERRLLPDGTLQLDATSAETYRLSIDCTGPRLAAGEHEVYIEVNGLPRLRIDVVVGAPGDGTIDGTIGGAILDVTCLGGHDVRLVR